MQRLTEKINGKWQTNGNANIDYIDTNESVFVGKAIDKLAEFEDFMEKQGFENLEQLKDFMQDTKNAMLDVLKVSDRWKELKKYVEKYADNFDEGIASVCDLILMKMKELEKDD